MNNMLKLNIQDDENTKLLEEKPNPSETTPLIEKKHDHHVKQRIVDIWHNILDIDPYYICFKQLMPLIPLLPATYEIIVSMISDQTNNTLANWFRVIDVFQNINIYVYGIFSAVLYVIFKKSKRVIEFMHTRRKYAVRIRAFNKGFLIYVILMSVLRFILGCFLPEKGAEPDNVPSKVFILNLFAQLGLMLFEIFYLYSVFIKKFYKFDEELDEIESWGIKNPENFKKNIKSSILKGFIEKQRDAILAEKLKAIAADKGVALPEGLEDRQQEPCGKECQEVSKKMWEYLQKGRSVNQKLLDHVKKLRDESSQSCKHHTETIQSSDEFCVKCMRYLLNHMRVRPFNVNNQEYFECKVRLCYTVDGMKRRIKETLQIPIESKIVLKVVNDEELQDEKFLFEYDIDMITQHLQVHY